MLAKDVFILADNWPVECLWGVGADAAPPLEPPPLLLFAPAEYRTKRYYHYI